MSNPIPEMLETTMDKIRTVADANTVVGNPIITPNGVTIIPISKVSFGFGSGGSEFSGKNGGNPFGGGGAAGVTVQPVAFLVVKGESVRMLPVAEAASSSLERIIEQLPDLLDRAEDFLARRKAAKDLEKAVEAELDKEKE